MKSICALTLTLLISTATAFPAPPSQPPLIPKTNNYSSMNTPAVVFDSLQIQSDPAFSEAFTRIFSKSLNRQFNIPSVIGADSPNLVFKKTGDVANDQSYTINVNGGRITVTSNSEIGAFYATQTLLQMIRSNATNWSIDSCIIKDSPRFASRGLMLDEARHFYGKDYVKHLLDTMAAHKMNVFHWHLTDDEGWRIQIKSYPKLTTVGAWHGEDTEMRTPERDQIVKDQDNPKYGGFYTQEDIKEIVAYAAERHITIIPEINLPGHSLALCTAYPDVRLTSDEGKEVVKNVISVVREENYLMLDKIIEEVASLFPNQYIHIGGHEIDHNIWKKSPEHRAFMQKKGMKNVSDLQVYFNLSLEGIIKKHGKEMMGWNEIMRGGRLSKNTAIMARNSVETGLDAARKGHPTVMAPARHCYLDKLYPGHSETGPLTSGVLDTERAYNWDPLMTGKLTSSQQKFIKGVQCNLWTEYVITPDEADYKFWPRASATAEVGWTDQNQRLWSDFYQRLGLHLSYLDTLDVKYRVKPPMGVLNRGGISIQPAYSVSTTVYTIDGSEPTTESTIYRGETFSVEQLKTLKFRTLTNNGRLSKIEGGAIRLPLGEWTEANISTLKPTLLSYPVTIDSDGIWFADLQRIKGAHNLKIHSAYISQGSFKYFAKPFSNNLLFENQITRLKFNLLGTNPNLKYKVNIVVSGINGNDSQGNVMFDKSEYQEPPFSVLTNVTHYMNRNTGNLSDYMPETYFHSNRKIFKGDTWTLRFTTAFNTNKIILPTGKPGSDDDILKTGTLEYSTDGTTWLSGVPITQGEGVIIFGKPQKIKALRVTATADQEGWVIIRDPLINP